MAKYTIYLDCPKHYDTVRITHLALRDNIDTFFIDDKYYFRYRDVLEQELEYHILRLFDLGWTIVKIKPVVE